MTVRAVTNVFNLDPNSTSNINHESIATLYSCVRLISNTISAIEIKHLNQEQEEITNSPLSRLIRNPQENVTYYSWMNSMVRDLQLHGNAYAIITPKELLYVPQDRVKIYITEQEENPFYYQISTYGKSFQLFPENVIHFKNVSPDGIIGTSPLQLHKATFNAASSMADYSSNFVKNSAAIGGIITTDKKLKKETIEELRGAFSQKFSGAENAGKIPVLSEGMQFKQINRISPTDMDFICLYLSYSNKNDIINYSHLSYV